MPRKVKFTQINRLLHDLSKCSGISRSKIRTELQKRFGGGNWKGFIAKVLVNQDRPFIVALLHGIILGRDFTNKTDECDLNIHVERGSSSVQWMPTCIWFLIISYIVVDVWIPICLRVLDWWVHNFEEWNHKRRVNNYVIFISSTVATLVVTNTVHNKFNLTRCYKSLI